eukprot:6490723-Amphidinium_carterae.1
MPYQIQTADGAMGTICLVTFNNTASLDEPGKVTFRYHFRGLPPASTLVQEGAVVGKQDPEPRADANVLAIRFWHASTACPAEQLAGTPPASSSAYRARHTIDEHGIAPR